MIRLRLNGCSKSVSDTDCTSDARCVTSPCLPAQKGAGPHARERKTKRKTNHINIDPSPKGGGGEGVDVR